MFAELNDTSESNDYSNHMESEDDVIIITEHEEKSVPLVAIVAEEHDNMINVEVQSNFNENQDTGGDGDDDSFNDDDSIFGGNLSSHDAKELNLEFDDDYYPTNEDLNSFFFNVNEVAQPEMETREVENVDTACIYNTSHYFNCSNTKRTKNYV